MLKTLSKIVLFRCVEVSHGEESAKKQLEALEKKFEQEEVLTVVTKATPCENELNNQIQKCVGY